ncbi:MAG: hypothetical protein CMH96_05340 [Oceanospirillaceae bacterium]|nr:hypothetical protein [Oceanospirillaceae bacterium]
MCYLFYQPSGWANCFSGHSALASCRSESAKAMLWLPSAPVPRPTELTTLIFTMYFTSLMAGPNALPANRP